MNVREEIKFVLLVVTMFAAVIIGHATGFIH